MNQLQKLVNAEFSKLHYNPATGIFTWSTGGRGIRKSAIAGTKNSEGYWGVRCCGRVYLAHRLAWFFVHGEWPHGGIDHINGDRMDNRLENLRVVAHEINMQNKRAAMANNNSCGLLGVTWNKQHCKWQSKLMASGKRHHIGYFDTAESAHEAYLNAKRILHPGCTI